MTTAEFERHVSVVRQQEWAALWGVEQLMGDIQAYLEFRELAQLPLEAPHSPPNAKKGRGEGNRSPVNAEAVRSVPCCCGHFRMTHGAHGPCEVSDCGCLGFVPVGSHWKRRRKK